MEYTLDVDEQLAGAATVYSSSTVAPMPLALRAGAGAVGGHAAIGRAGMHSVRAGLSNLMRSGEIWGDLGRSGEIWRHGIRRTCWPRQPRRFHRDRPTP